jgi:(S)-mandelate dehydrogenase
MEKVKEAAGGRLWYQMYIWPDRAMSHSLIDRARAAGFEALVITVDTAIAPNREYNVRNGYSTSFRFTAKNVADVLAHPRWLLGTLGRYIAEGGMPRFENYPESLRHRITDPKFDQRSMMSASVTWEDIRLIRKKWPGALIVKGLLHPEDALMAVQCGADAIVVSNHGARNLDSSVAPIDVLPEMVDAVGHKLAVLVDSGFRRGSDVVKAMALGAKAVLIGRGTLYGVAAGGRQGAARALAIYRSEIDRVMTYLGCDSIGALNRGHLII